MVYEMNQIWLLLDSNLNKSIIWLKMKTYGNNQKNVYWSMSIWVKYVIASEWMYENNQNWSLMNVILNNVWCD